MSLLNKLLNFARKHKKTSSNSNGSNGDNVSIASDAVLKNKSYFVKSGNVNVNEFRQPAQPQQNQQNQQRPPQEKFQFNQIASNGKTNTNSSTGAHSRTLSHKKSSSMSGIQNFTNGGGGGTNNGVSNNRNNGNEINMMLANAKGPQNTQNIAPNTPTTDKGFYNPVYNNNNAIPSNNSATANNNSNSYRNQIVDNKVNSFTPKSPMNANKTSKLSYEGNTHKNEIITDIRIASSVCVQLQRFNKKKLIMTCNFFLNFLFFCSLILLSHFFCFFFLLNNTKNLIVTIIAHKLK